MKRLDQYIALIQNYPELVKSSRDDTIDIITNPETIQKKVSDLRREFLKQGKPETYAEIGVLVDDPYFLVLRDLVKFPNGKIGGYIRFINRSSLEGGKATAILPLYKQKVLLLRNFRHATRQWELEIPRGFGEIGLSAQENARKELLEETGLKPAELVLLGKIHTDTAVRSSPTFLFYARIEELCEPEVESEEVISERILVTTGEFEKLVVQGGIADSFSISAYCMAKIQNFL